MRPIRRKSGFAIIDRDESEEIFEATVLGEQHTLHIEEDVPSVRTWQAGKPFPSDSGSVST